MTPTRSVPPLFLAVLVTSMGLSAPSAAAEKVQFVVDASRSGPKIDRNHFGQFAEHLGHGIHEGI
jgi:alpha-N-arabinofuranosidase